MKRLSFLLFSLVLAACSATQPEVKSREPNSDFFGVATLDKDETLCLQMRSEEPGRPVAEAYRCYAPGDPGYSRVRKHVGAISIGESKEFGPFEN